MAKLRRLADELEAGERFEIQVAGERIYVPARAEFNVEHEREGGEEEIEFQLKWTNSSTSSRASSPHHLSASVRAGRDPDCGTPTTLCPQPRREGEFF